MFDHLSKGLNKILDKIKGRGVISASDMDEAGREIRIALLEADVALPVIKDLIERIKQKAVGQEVVKSIKPGQMIVKIINDELVDILGGKDDEQPKLNLQGQMPVIMMVGLQGSGKTTSSAKLAAFLRKKHGRKPFLISTDIYRPAAQLQLLTLAKQTSIPCLDIIPREEPIDITKRGMQKAKESNCDIVIIDTAGRLQTDDDLMIELEEIAKLTKPNEIFFVADSMLGQEAANIAQIFCERLDVTGIILTRVDGDARGGAALSMKYTTGKPIRFVGVGEKIDEFELFHPERTTSRILGMGDIVSLVEKATSVIKADEVEDIQKRLETGRIDMNDILKQIQNVKKIGSISSIMGMIPGIGKMKEKLSEVAGDAMIKKQEAIIQSMTMKERRNPIMITPNRKKRIAQGSGTTVADVNALLKKFSDMQMMFKKMGKMDMSKMQNMFKNFK